MPPEYEIIKQQQGLFDSSLRRLFEQYCIDCHNCTNKIEWSCKVSTGHVWHNDRFVHVSSTTDRKTWFSAGEKLLRKLLPSIVERDYESILRRLSVHSKQLFVGYSGKIATSQEKERIKLYFSLSGECDGLWVELKERIGYSMLVVPPPTVSAWLLVFVLTGDETPIFRVDLVYDSIEFRNPVFLENLQTFLSADEIEFIGREARGIVSLREAEKEMLYSYVEFSRPEAPLRMMAERLTVELPEFRRRLNNLTWIGIPRGTLREVEKTPITLYTKISGPKFQSYR